ncbi:MAG: malate dehydrogenase [Candidatus Omnitrophica bacterium]|nr:malate dehydrogenase [Candidatus Omnitrophota bacterium]MBU4457454.1 malate dehydrogenase [Candidatus Omnitrophota bacterium]
MQIAIVGAGNVGAMTASRVVDDNLADVVLVDIVPGLAKGKALDISDARPVFDSKAQIIGTGDYKDIKGSDIIVITAGLARKPGMSRDDLLQKNSKILTDISNQVKEYCPNSIVIVVTNPLDAMTYLVMKKTGFDPRRVIGMAGVLDSARFLNIISEKAKSVDKDKIFMMGSHGDTMVAINRSENLSKELFNQSLDRARQRGAEIVSHLKTGSAYFSPSASVFHMLKAIIKNENKTTLCASVYLQGEYGEKDLYIGVPVKLDSTGIKEVIEIDFTDEEKTAFKKSAQSIRSAISKLK